MSDTMSYTMSDITCDTMSVTMSDTMISKLSPEIGAQDPLVAHLTHGGVGFLHLFVHVSQGLVVSVVLIDWPQDVIHL